MYYSVVHVYSQSHSLVSTPILNSESLSSFTLMYHGNLKEMVIHFILQINKLELQIIIYK